jgi:hypothetical protein
MENADPASLICGTAVPLTCMSTVVVVLSTAFISMRYSTPVVMLIPVALLVPELSLRAYNLPSDA